MMQWDSSRLDPDDLIRDREVDNAQDDRLAHRHIADQLRDVVLSVPTPTNIAVWGPWGSGKSGVANLLKELLEQRRGVRFVRFDAFKYAENPLRRNFIVAVATALGDKDPKFHDGLYGGRVAVKLQFEKSDVWRLLKMFGLTFGAVVAFFGAAMALFAWLHGGAFRPTFANMAAGALKAGIAPAALLTSLMLLVSRTLTREHKTEAADSDEQFEKLFCDLIARSREERLVVFVDELDRCNPPDVVATLDALRTFLGAGGCVFVVAADQQVLEEARQGIPVPNQPPTAIGAEGDQLRCRSGARAERRLGSDKHQPGGECPRTLPCAQSPPGQVATEHVRADVPAGSATGRRRAAGD
ncbi:P-loop NTPase fold protein [Streptomyces sp. NPDC021098]|uniref:KAP family P-loop NTPase fold protein n=1 Tax=unclassified Streptomyces TaxID=2593676 RepID=UPI00378FDE90